MEFTGLQSACIFNFHINLWLISGSLTTTIDIDNNCVTMSSDIDHGQNYVRVINDSESYNQNPLFASDGVSDGTVTV